MSKPGPITDTMRGAISLAQDHGNKLHRHPGGFWRGQEKGNSGMSFGTSTVQGLVNRGVATYTEYKQGRCGEFPIQITLNAGWRV